MLKGHDVMNRFVGAAAIVAATIASGSPATAQDSGNRHRQVFETDPDSVKVITKPFGAMTSSAANGETQILGIVATRGPVPFQCANDGCRAHLSSFCLQQARDNPRPGQTYIPLGGADLVLSGRDKAGRLVQLAAGPYLDFETDRGLTDIAVALPSAKLAALGLHDFAIKVGEQVSLLPVASAEDRAILDRGDDAIAADKLRRRAVGFFDQSSEAADGIRLANLMINLLPARGSASDSDGGVLEAAISSSAGQASGIEGRALTEKMYAACRDKVDGEHYFDSMRSCLEASHDQLVMHTNVDFWNSLAGD